jgi:signal transduction histidine kinase
MFKTLSGRFLILTIVFVMLAEILIFVPSIARFRLDYLNARIERAQLASLALLADDMLSPELEAELLATADVYNVVLIRDAARQLVLSSELPQPVSQTFDLRDPKAIDLIKDTFARLLARAPEIIRVIGTPAQGAGQLIEVTLETITLRSAMVDYGLRILWLSAVISAITALLLFVAVRILIVKPIKRVAQSMSDYARAPNDIRRIIAPSSSITDIYQAESALAQMQGDLSASLKQKQRLATLGEAVAKVSHDLRNILSSVQLLSDRMEESQDPMVQRMAPRLIRSVSRAVSLTENTLAFGRVQEPVPHLERVALKPIVEDVFAQEDLATNAADCIRYVCKCDALVFRVDPEHLSRIIQNLVRNARQAMQFSQMHGDITVEGMDTGTHWIITISDQGPGLPEKAKQNLFQAFAGGVNKEGTGLGLVIAQELVAGHGGQLDLVQSDRSGTVFKIALPKSVT